MVSSRERWNYLKTAQQLPRQQVSTPDHTHTTHPLRVCILYAVELDEGVVMQLVSMGFDIEGCKRAVYHTHNQGVESAMNWVLEHMGDPGMCIMCLLTI